MTPEQLLVIAPLRMAELGIRYWIFGVTWRRMSTMLCVICPTSRSRFAR